MATEAQVSSSASWIKNTLEPDKGMKVFTIIMQGLFSWPGIVLIIALCCVWLFKQEISEVLKKIIKIKASGGGLEAEMERRVDEKLPKNEELSKEEEEEPESPKIIEPKTLDEWRTEMIFSTFAKNQARADEAFLKTQELNTDLLSRKQDEVLYLKFSYSAGKADVIQRLKSFLVDTEVEYEVNMALGFCYADSEDFESATKFYSQALERAKDEKEKVGTAIDLSFSLYQDNKKDMAIEVLSRALTAAVEDVNKIKLYKSLGDMYEKEGDYESRAFVLDKAVELKPNDTSLIFKAGYSYAESEYDEIAFLHYKNARDINPEDEAVQNNLGVQYESLKMPIKSISSYKKAEGLGNTLASANLAYRLMNSGFLEEAKSVLDAAVIKKDAHPNVHSALSDLPKKNDKEDQVEKEKIKLALNLRKFFLGFTEAKFIQDNALNNIVSGEWQSDAGISFQLLISNERIIGTWKEKIISYEYDWKFEGEIINNSSAFITYEKEYSLSKNKDEYKKKGRGFLFCSADSKTIKLIRVDDPFQAKKVYTLTRN